MPIYEIVNPSDKCTIEAPDDDTAAIAVIILGEGQYGCETQDGKSLGTLLLFASKEDIHKIFDGLGIPPADKDYENGRLDKYLKDKDNGEKIAAVFESLMYCGTGERKALLTALDGVPDRLDRMAKYNDERRSSMNNIGNRAHEYAKHIRDSLKKAKAK